MESQQYLRSEGPGPPAGTLVAIGGNEDKENDLSILRTTVRLSTARNPLIALITTASSVPEAMAGTYLKAFGAIGSNRVEVLHISTREEAADEGMLAVVKESDIVFFTGGDQLRITSIMGGLPVLTEVRRKFFTEDCVVAGTSAGASALSETMIYEGESPEALKKGTVQMTSGIGLLRKVVIDSHFIKRGRFSRLMEMVAGNPGIIGLGLGEDSGVIIRGGHHMEAIGQGLIVIFDGKTIAHSNIPNIEMGAAIAVNSVTVHTLVKGYGYDTLTREYILPGGHPRDPQGD